MLVVVLLRLYCDVVVGIVEGFWNLNIRKEREGEEGRCMNMGKIEKEKKIIMYVCNWVKKIFFYNYKINF